MPRININPQHYINPAPEAQTREHDEMVMFVTRANREAAVGTVLPIKKSRMIPSNGEVMRVGTDGNFYGGAIHSHGAPISGGNRVMVPLNEEYTEWGYGVNDGHQWVGEGDERKLQYTVGLLGSTLNVSPDPSLTDRYTINAPIVFKAAQWATSTFPYFTDHPRLVAAKLAAAESHWKRARAEYNLLRNATFRRWDHMLSELEEAEVPLPGGLYGVIVTGTALISTDTSRTTAVNSLSERVQGAIAANADLSLDSPGPRQEVETAQVALTRASFPSITGHSRTAAEAQTHAASNMHNDYEIHFGNRPLAISHPSMQTVLVGVQ